MTLRWIFICIILLSMQIAMGIPSSSKKETIPEDAKIFIDASAREYEEVVRSRQRRVGPEPLEMSVTVKDTVNTTTSSTVMNRSMNDTESLASEAKDMEETSVSPKDDEDPPVTTTRSINKSSSILPSKNISDVNVKLTKEEIVKTALESTTTTTTVSPVKIEDEEKLNLTLSELAKNATMPPKILPENASRFDEVDAKLQERLNHTKYVTNSGEINVTLTPDTITPLYDVVYVDSTTNPSTTDPVKMTLKSEQESLEKSNIKIAENKNEKTGMPTGIVALIIAIAFAVFAVIGYAGLMVWKRYLEYRYGNRELLVNDFDANDINNFEL